MREQGNDGWKQAVWVSDEQKYFQFWLYQLQLPKILSLFRKVFYYGMGSAIEKYQTFKCFIL